MFNILKRILFNEHSRNSDLITSETLIDEINRLKIYKEKIRYFQLMDFIFKTQDWSIEVKDYIIKINLMGKKIEVGYDKLESITFSEKPILIQVLKNKEGKFSIKAKSIGPYQLLQLEECFQNSPNGVNINKPKIDYKRIGEKYMAQADISKLGKNDT